MSASSDKIWLSGPFSANLKKPSSQLKARSLIKCDLEYRPDNLSKVFIPIQMGVAAWSKLQSN